MTDAYPLTWPGGWKRTAYPKRSNFGEHSIAQGSNEIERELNLLGAKSVIISSNLTRRLDGGIRSGQSEPSDRGVAVYFNLDGQPQCMPCDRWDRVSHNLWAIAKTVEALRSVDRWGAKEMVRAAFRGFLALPAPMDYALETKSTADLKEMMRQAHPDTGASPNTERFMAALSELRKRKSE